MTRTLILSFALALAACGGDKDDENTGDSGTPDPTDTDTDTDTDSTPTAATGDTGTGPIVPDPFDGLAFTCSTSIAEMVFTYYYVGEVTIDEVAQTFEGTETMAFFASKQLQGECSIAPDCVVVYNLSGNVGPSSQPGPTVRLGGSAMIDLGATTCDDTYSISWEPYQFGVDYALTRDKKGTTTAAFEGSGTVFGEGHWAADQATWVSEAQCTALPDPPYTPCPP